MRGKIKGFSLVELSIVILILSVFLSTTVSFLAKKSAVDKNAITKERMERIAEALKIYFEKMDLVDGDASDNDGYIPCPSNIAAALNNAQFGVGADNGSNCTQYLDASASLNICSGGVPFTTLGLPAQYAFDAWGNRISYVLDRDMRFTFAASTPNIRVNDEYGSSLMWRSPKPAEYNTSVTDCTGASIAVGQTTSGTAAYADRSTSTTRILGCAAFLLVSHGANGYSAYNARGSQIGSSASYAVNAAQGSNSPIDIDAYTFDQTFVDMPINQDTKDSTYTEYFDDILVYRTKEWLTTN